MSTLTSSREIQVPPDRLFTHLATAWESGDALGGEKEGCEPGLAARMGPGFRVPCPAEPWALPGEAELEVVDYQEPGGWLAVSVTDVTLSWQVRIESRKGVTRLTNILQHQPKGLRAWLRETLIRRRFRRTALRRLLDEWGAEAEREEAFRRLRARAGGWRPESGGAAANDVACPEPRGNDLQSGTHC